MNQKRKTKPTLLLLQDVVNLGKKGELASAKPGFIRNFLLPQKKAVLADKRTIRMQETLRKERIVEAAKDKKEAQSLATHLKDTTLTIKVKNDPQGHLYGSVSSVDIVKLLKEEEGVVIERKNVILPKPIKLVGTYDIDVKLKENVSATFTLQIEGEIKVEESKSQVQVMEESEEEVSHQTNGEFPINKEKEEEQKTKKPSKE